MMVRGMRVELISDDYKSSALTAVLTPHYHYKKIERSIKYMWCAYSDSNQGTGFRRPALYPPEL